MLQGRQMKRKVLAVIITLLILVSGASVYFNTIGMIPWQTLTIDGVQIRDKELIRETQETLRDILKHASVHLYKEKAKLEGVGSAVYVANGKFFNPYGIDNVWHVRMLFLDYEITDKEDGERLTELSERLVLQQSNIIKSRIK